MNGSVYARLYIQGNTHSRPILCKFYRHCLLWHRDRRLARLHHACSRWSRLAARVCPRSLDRRTLRLPISTPMMSAKARAWTICSVSPSSPTAEQRAESRMRNIPAPPPATRSSTPRLWMSTSSEDHDINDPRTPPPSQAVTVCPGSSPAAMGTYAVRDGVHNPTLCSSASSARGRLRKKAV